MIKKKIFTQGDNNAEAGFNLLEMLMVVALLAVISTIVVNLFYSIMSSARKASVINNLKQNGSHAMAIMERTIRNAKNVPVCTGVAVDSLTLTNADNSTTTLIVPTPYPTTGPWQIVSSYASLAVAGTAPPPTVTNLTAANTSVQAPRTIFTCTQGSNTPDLIKINFNLEPAGAGSLRQEEKTTINFQTTVSLRNFIQHE